MMTKITAFSFHPFEKETFVCPEIKEKKWDMHCFECTLTQKTATLAQDAKIISCFVNDQLDATTLKQLAAQGTEMIALRCAGYNQVDLDAAHALNIQIARVPAYSPYAVAEFATGLILSLNRKLHRAYHRVHDFNFSLDGLVGFDLNKKTVGIIGTGNIGSVFAKIMRGFDCHVLAYDPVQNPALEAIGVEYVSLDTLYTHAQIISLHCPLTPKTHHLINEKAIQVMRPDVMLINTSRGGLIDSQAIITALKQQRISALGIDVYEEEGDLFFQDLSNTVVQDDTISRLQTFPNVLITGHQAFLTQEALDHIAETTFDNIRCFLQNSSNACFL